MLVSAGMPPHALESSGLSGLGGRRATGQACFGEPQDPQNLLLSASACVSLRFRNTSVPTLLQTLPIPYPLCSQSIHICHSVVFPVSLVSLQSLLLPAKPRNEKSCHALTVGRQPSQGLPVPASTQQKPHPQAIVYTYIHRPTISLASKPSRLKALDINDRLRVISPSATAPTEEKRQLP